MDRFPSEEAAMQSSAGPEILHRFSQRGSTEGPTRNASSHHRRSGSEVQDDGTGERPSHSPTQAKDRGSRHRYQRSAAERADYAFPANLSSSSGRGARESSVPIHPFDRPERGAAAAQRPAAAEFGIEDDADALAPLRQPPRRRYDSVSSVGSSVAPGALPNLNGSASRNRSGSRRHPAAPVHPKHLNAQHAEDPFSLPTSPTAPAAPPSGGLETWLRSQAAHAPPSAAQSGAVTHEHFSGAPAGRVTRRGPSSDAGSDAAYSVSAFSSGARGQGSGARRRAKQADSQRRLPDWEEAEPDFYENGEGEKTPKPARRREESYDERSTGGRSVGRERPRKKESATQLDALAGTGVTPSSSAILRTPSTAVDLTPAKSSTSRTSFAPLPTGSSAGRRLVGLHKLGSSARSSRLNDSPLRRWVRWMARESEDGSAGAGEKVTWIVVLLSAVWVRSAVSLAGWSGKGAGPMYGDLEAQRHWMELTMHVPVRQWYEYDLQYWGLDYPPLTAYVSLVCGWIGSRIPGLSQSFAFVSSRGAEHQGLITYLRATVLFFDLLVYMPAVLLFLSRRLHGRGRRTRSMATLTILLQPSLILVDHGHFQYNSVMLGFCVGASALLYSSLPNPDLPFFSAPNASASAPTDETAMAEQADWQTRTKNLSRRVSYDYVLAAFFFTLALCFKQMALYFAPAVFAIMLGRCAGLARVGFERGLICFTGIGAVTLITTLVLFSPWLHSPSALFQVIHRIFPLARGIFEDKVSNLWCFLSVLPLPQRYKLRTLLEMSSLAKVSLLTTLLAIAAPCAHLYVAASQTVSIEMFLNEGEGAKAAREKLARQRGEGSVMGRSVGGRSTGARSAVRSERRDRSRSILSVPAGPAQSEGGASEGGVSGMAASVVAPSITGALSSSGSLFGNSSNMAATGEQEVASNTPSPAASVLPYALLSTSLAFFLFGFQTHEKSILLPLMPLTLLITVKGDEWGGGGGKTDWEWALLGNNVAVFSMWPLLQRDGLTLQYLVLNFMWNWLVGYNPFTHLQNQRKSFIGWTSAFAHAAILSLHLLEVLLPALAPKTASNIYARYPDIHPVLNVLLCTPLFGLLWLWAVARQVEVGLGCGVDPTAFLRRSKKSPSSSNNLKKRAAPAKQE